jgi:hypothetical protein
MWTMSQPPFLALQTIDAPSGRGDTQAL